MKFKDVKIGMRVALVDFESEVQSFHTVNGIDPKGCIVTLDDDLQTSSVYLRKLKPKESVSWESSVQPATTTEPYLNDRSCPALARFAGKRVRVTVREIK